MCRGQSEQIVVWVINTAQCSSFHHGQSGEGGEILKWKRNRSAREAKVCSDGEQIWIWSMKQRVREVCAGKQPLRAT